MPGEKDLHPYQKFCVDFLEEKPQCALFLDCGLGKTIITLTAISHLLYDSYEVNRVLIIAPLRVARDTWIGELSNTFHDGMGAMEMRAYFAGDITVRAICGNLSCERHIQAVGDMEWDGRAMRLPEPLPYVSAAPEHHSSFDLAVQRPVFASNDADRTMVRNLVDSQVFTDWRVTQPSWATIDLEGNKAFHMLVVDMNAGDASDVVLSLSTDGQHFIPVENTKTDENEISAEIDGSWRYVRIEAKRAGVAIQAVHCMVK